jgi:hypothetical protein
MGNDYKICPKCCSSKNVDAIVITFFSAHPVFELECSDCNEKWTICPGIVPIDWQIPPEKKESKTDEK